MLIPPSVLKIGLDRSQNTQIGESSPSENGQIGGCESLPKQTSFCSMPAKENACEALAWAEKGASWHLTIVKTHTVMELFEDVIECCTSVGDARIAARCWCSVKCCRMVVVSVGWTI
jgi:hypothetical protein